MEMNFDRLSEDPVQRRAVKLSLVGTLVVWIVLAVGGSIAVRFKKEPVYHAIKLSLEPAVQKVENRPYAPEPSIPSEKTSEPQDTKLEQTQVAQVSSPKPENPSSTQKPASESSKPAVQQTVKPVPVPAVKDSPSVQKPASSTRKDSSVREADVSAPKKENIVYKKSVEELMAEQQRGSVAKKSVDWDEIFGDDNHASSSTSSSPVNTSTQSNISGAAALSGTAAISSGGSNVKAVSEVDRKSTSQTASSSTSSSLSKIASTTYRKSQSLENDFVATTSTSTSSSTDGRVSLDMSDGTSRILLDPSKPIIMISPENGKLLDGPRSVVINFKVLPGGNVPFSGITFTPSSALPLAIQSEIKDQISKWRFMAGPSESTARFELEIKKR